ncbi:hypothetical protein H0H92_013378 [Tricholoma furcatifolium]|nr:hypothetical protein H0H92_013378 [Tricholoma furcatifolium]
MFDDSIVLSTPPPSPHFQPAWDDPTEFASNRTTLDLNVSNVFLPDADVDLPLSPVKRPRTYSMHPRQVNMGKRSRSAKHSISAEDCTNNIPLPLPLDVVVNSENNSTIDDIPDCPLSPDNPQSFNDDNWTYDEPEALDPLLAPSFKDSDNDSYPEFVAAALSACIGIYRLTQTVFVVQGWDGRTANATRHWYHLQILAVGADIVHICLCPNNDQSCVHTEFLRDYGENEFSDKEEDIPVLLRPVVLIFRDRSQGNHLFSVETPTKHGIRSRAIVMYDGEDDGSGIWRCAKDGRGGCSHTKAARDYLQKLITLDPNARDPNRESEHRNDDVQQAITVVQGTSSISHKPILPPLWAQLPTDDLIYSRPNPVLVAPSLIPLETDARCTCGCIRSHDKEVTVRPCRLYLLTGCYDTTIEIQQCSDCKGKQRRFIGPDCREMGIFNFNNRILFSHDLLDEYTMAFTSSETPFFAWVSVAARRYQVHNAQHPFVTETIFRAAWFAYAVLLQLDGDFQCLRCGTSPDEPIFDGVVVSFSKTRVLPSLRPPTVQHVDSVVRNSRLVKGKAPIVHAQLRKNILRIVNGPPLILKEPVITQMGESDNNSEDPESDADEDVEQQQTSDTRASKEIHARASLIPSIMPALRAIDLSLGELFDKIFCASLSSVPLPYKRLFAQQRGTLYCK